MDVYKLFYNIGVQHMFRKTLKSKALTILSLHRISVENNYFWNPIQPAVFDQLCSYAAKNYHVITFEQIATSRDAEKPLLILSFDDGYYDFMENAMPILKKHKLPANHNIVYQCAESNMAIWTQRLNQVFQFLYKNNITDIKVNTGGDTALSLATSGGNWRAFYNSVYLYLVRQKQAEREPVIAALEQRYGVQADVKMMNWNDIASLVSEGIEIGNHTWSHDAIATIDDAAVMHREIVESKQQLEEKLHVPISIFSLPNGETTSRLSESIQQAGYSYVLELNEKTNRLAGTDKGNKIYNRITIGDEPAERMILRAETFQSTLQKFFK